MMETVENWTKFRAHVHINRIKIVRDFLLAQLRGLFLTIMTGRFRDRFCIKHNYLHRKVNAHFDARGSTDEYQDKVYEAIQTFFGKKNLSSIVDIGCGSGFKLMKYFSDARTLGTEVEPALTFLRTKYPNRSWMVSDFCQIPDGKYDMAICVDVIEHLDDPDSLLKFIKRIDCSFIALSTPERDQLGRVRARIGPPLNKYHIREWNEREFVDYIGRHFDILETGVVAGNEQYVIARQSHCALADQG